MPVFEILTLVAFLVSMVVGPIAWYRTVRAKNRAAYWKNIALFVGPIALTFLFADAAGLLPEATTPPPTAPNLQEVFERMPTRQVILLAVVAVVWIGGGNLLSYFQNRRLGKRWWQGMNPLDPPFKDFNGREMAILLALATVSLGLVAIVMS